MSNLTIPPTGQLNLPGSPPPGNSFEKTINHIISLVAGIIKVPIVFVTLQEDKQRYSFKASEGLEFNQAEWEACCPYPPDFSEIIIVSDTLQDARFAHNPLITNPPYIRFYAALPLQTKDGSNIPTTRLN